MSERALRIGLPVLMLALVLLAWDVVVRAFAIPPFVLPGPGLVLSTLIADGGLLWQSLLVTLTTTFEGFLLAAIGGIGLAVLFSQSRLIEYSLYPYAVILQVTPVVAIAPLLLIYLDAPAAVLACAFLVAIVSLLTLYEYVFGWDLGLDQLLFRDLGALPGEPPGRRLLAWP